ncbi:3-dehydro-L-gulonate 2-dehydrogenase [Aquipluma nitroreducens]|uniref:3-dehydro-L-gulonate 2-dehydrogenase n=1 Tax=Aquipluma nitroreducens TaxID=2010828 RepID=A0A5K7SDA3_9BACT|nr:3-dehydro-L-gulonate 2-dehydrogenase [Aquipluma nitroreducens]BBE19582.1 3-dehydro-L-gulonate 2-dehydrogenase [Aquipluma nitroreducens]
MTRISFNEMKATIKSAFMNAGMPEEKADICAQVHTESSRDGVYSHGLNRVERFVDYLGKGWVDGNAAPTLELNLGSMEIYNGNLGPGILNALFAMNRATEIAAQNGLGLVSLNNTTHWMRGGAYGWQAAEKGFIGICWTNTESCMPAWGAKSCGIGNNPFIMAVPRKEGHVVLDMAMSQYSYGKLQTTRLKDQKLPYPGGFDQEGKLTDNPGEIEETRRILPMGFWKGSGFAVMLDLISALLSGGLTTSGIDKADKGSCGSCCQIFIAIDPQKINTQEFIDQALNETIEQLKSSVPANENAEIFYPGEQSLKTRLENMELGIPVDDGIWANVKALAKLS